MRTSPIERKIFEKFGRAGGVARAEKLPQERRRAIAIAAGLANKKRCNRLYGKTLRKSAK